MTTACFPYLTDRVRWLGHADARQVLDLPLPGLSLLQDLRPVQVIDRHIDGHLTASRRPAAHRAARPWEGRIRSRVERDRDSPPF
jgi:hypothetical protein